MDTKDKSRSRSISSEREGANEAMLKKAREGIKKRAKKPSFFARYGYHIVIGLFVIVCSGALFSTLMADHRKITEIPVIESRDIESHNREDYSHSLGPNTFFEVFLLNLGLDVIRC